MLCLTAGPRQSPDRMGTRRQRLPLQHVCEWSLMATMPTPTGCSFRGHVLGEQACIALC